MPLAGCRSLQTGDQDHGKTGDQACSLAAIGRPRRRTRSRWIGAGWSGAPLNGSNGRDPEVPVEDAGNRLLRPRRSEPSGESISTLTCAGRDRPDRCVGHWQSR